MDFKIVFPEQPVVGHKVNTEFNGFTVSYRSTTVLWRR